MKPQIQHQPHRRPLLLIEDDAIDETAFRRAAQYAALAMPIICATSAEEALTRLGQAPRPSLIVLDLNLPGMDGITALERLLPFRIPIVVLTTSRDERDIARAYTAGVSGYFAKPLDNNDYLTVIAAIGRYWSLCEPAP
jgi:CheY-like chemotaxis protein